MIEKNAFISEERNAYEEEERNLHCICGEQHTLSGLDYGGDEEQVISIEEATNDNN